MALSLTPTTDEVRDLLGEIAYTNSGQPQSLDLGQVNYACELECEIAGTMTCTGASANTLFAKGPSGLILAAYIQVDSKMVPLSADAFGFRLLKMFDRPGAKQPAVAPVVTSAGGSANTWLATFRMPLSVAMDRNDLRGTVWLQNKGTKAKLWIVWANPNQVINLGAGNTAAFSGQLTVSMRSITAPPPVAATKTAQAQGLWYQASWVHAFRESSQELTQTGQVQIPLDTGVQHMRTLIAVKNNGDYTTDILSDVGVQVQNIIQPVNFDNTWLREQLCERYLFDYDPSTALPYPEDAEGTPELTGLYLLDWFTTFTDRDLLDARNLTSLNLVLTVPGGTDLVGAQVDVYQEELIQLSAPYTKV